MKALGIYEWIAGSMADFTRQFGDNEVLFAQAKTFWRQLDGATGVSIALFVVIGIALAAWYYKPYNEKPGRHYKPSHWLGFLFIAFVSTLAVVFLYEICSVSSSLRGATRVEFMVAVGSGIYACAVFLLTSVVWCNLFPTNAYRLFKF